MTYYFSLDNTLESFTQYGFSANARKVINKLICRITNVEKFKTVVFINREISHINIPISNILLNTTYIYQNRITFIRCSNVLSRKYKYRFNNVVFIHTLNDIFFDLLEYIVNKNNNQSNISSETIMYFASNMLYSKNTTYQIVPISNLSSTIYFHKCIEYYFKDTKPDDLITVEYDNCIIGMNGIVDLSNINSNNIIFICNTTDMARISKRNNQNVVFKIRNNTLSMISINTDSTNIDTSIAMILLHISDTYIKCYENRTRISSAEYVLKPYQKYSRYKILIELSNVHNTKIFCLHDIILQINNGCYDNLYEGMKGLMINTTNNKLEYSSIILHSQIPYEEINLDSMYYCICDINVVAENIVSFHDEYVIVKNNNVLSITNIMSLDEIKLVRILIREKNMVIENDISIRNLILSSITIDSLVFSNNVLDKLIIKKCDIKYLRIHQVNKLILKNNNINKFVFDNILMLNELLIKCNNICMDENEIYSKLLHHIIHDGTLTLSKFFLPRLYVGNIRITLNKCFVLEILNPNNMEITRRNTIIYNNVYDK